MAELEFRFPSDQPYAYFSVRGTPEELARLDFEMVAQLYVNTQFSVLKGTVAAKDAILAPSKPEPKPQEYAVGDTVEVGGTTFTKHSEAADALSEGLGGTTELDDVNAPPWKGDAPTAKPKAWEQERPAPKVSAEDFDF